MLVLLLSPRSVPNGPSDPAALPPGRTGHVDMRVQDHDHTAPRTTEELPAWPSTAIVYLISLDVESQSASKRRSGCGAGADVAVQSGRVERHPGRRQAGRHGSGRERRCATSRRTLQPGCDRTGDVVGLDGRIGGTCAPMLRAWLRSGRRDVVKEVGVGHVRSARASSMTLPAPPGFRTRMIWVFALAE